MPSPSSGIYSSCCVPVCWNGITCRARIIDTAEDSLNIALREITVTARDGRVSQLEQVYIRGSMVGPLTSFTPTPHASPIIVSSCSLYRLDVIL